MKLFTLFNGTFSYRIIGYKLSLSKGGGGRAEERGKPHDGETHTIGKRTVVCQKFEGASLGLLRGGETFIKRGGGSCVTLQSPHLPGCPPRSHKAMETKKASLPPLIKMDVSPSRVRKA